jgi:hypothetical protein
MRSLITQGSDVDKSSLTIALTTTLADMMGLAQGCLDHSTLTTRRVDMCQTHVCEGCHPLRPTGSDHSDFRVHHNYANWSLEI